MFQFLAVAFDGQDNLRFGVGKTLNEAYTCLADSVDCEEVNPLHVDFFLIGDKVETRVDVNFYLKG